MLRTIFLCTLLAFTLLALGPLPGDNARAQSQPDLRPTFMGKVYRFEGGVNDGKLGYLFRVWNKSGANQTLSSLPGTFNKPTFGILSAGGKFADGTPSFAGDPPQFKILFASGQETLRPSPSDAFEDRPANIVVLTAATTNQIVYALNGRTATGALANATVETIRPPALSGKLEVVAINVARTTPTGDAELALTVSNGTAGPLQALKVKAYSTNPNIVVKRDAVAIGTLGSGASYTPLDTLIARRTSGSGFALSEFAFAFDDNTNAGLDIDNDGIRDDIEVFIDQELAQTPEQRIALRGLATFLLAEQVAATQADVRAAHNQSRQHLDCVLKAFSGDTDAAEKLDTEIVNSDKRVTEHLQSMRLRGQLPTYTFPTDADISAFCSDPANTNY